MAALARKASAPPLSKAEYLKRYLSGEQCKKRRKRPKPSGRGMRIVDDDDVSWKSVSTKEETMVEDEEDLPMVAQFVDERPEEVKRMEEFRMSNKWKLFQDQNENPHHSELSLAARSDESSDTASVKKEENRTKHFPEASSPQKLCYDSSIASPPRRPRHDSPDASPPRRLRHDSPDASPPRRPRHDSPDASPPRRPRHDSPDASPPRRQRHKSPDASPPRRQRHDSPDTSPPRRQRHDSPDASPPRRQRHDSPDALPPMKGHCSSDLFPHPKKLKHGLVTELPSKKSSKTIDRLQPSTSSHERGSTPARKRHSSSDSSPVRSSRHDSDLDTPPSRKKHPVSLAHGTKLSSTRGKAVSRHHHDLDMAPPGRKSSDSDVSPPRNIHKSGSGRSDSDLSPPRRLRKRSSDSDFSPPRQRSQAQKCSNLSPSQQGRASRGSPQRAHAEGSKLSQMLSGGRAGLVSAEVLKEEQEEMRRRERSNKHLEDESRTAETIFRDKSGRKRDLKQERAEQRQKADKKAKRDEQYAQWGKGLAQREQQEHNLQDAVKEMEKPLARYIHDKDLDQMLRDQEREGDPMANFIKKKKAKENPNKKERPRYSGPTPPLNRFNIWPGYRWDGVDRSNGFEQQRFARQANQKAVQEVAYKWSVEDM
ncbi:BUD13 homolog [Rhinatrema bivittatum]|uniref:BUD13 homolog n=1 Tax=Rhinatrema bivittatum TaxID=194408 RepID=UPI0011290FFE|nr:BUD13 homolog [Rhinatrema bivittatum]